MASPPESSRRETAKVASGPRSVECSGEIPACEMTLTPPEKKSDPPTSGDSTVTARLLRVCSSQDSDVISIAIFTRSDHPRDCVHKTANRGTCSSTNYWGGRTGFDSSLKRRDGHVEDGSLASSLQTNQKNKRRSPDLALAD